MKWLSIQRNSGYGILFWLTVTVVSLCFAYFNTYVAVGYSEFPPLGGDIKNIIQVIQKYDDPTLFSRDFIFSDNGYKLYMPYYVHLIRFLDRLTGTHNYEITLHLMMFPICFLFVLSMTWLLWRITKSRWLSLIMALSATLAFEVIYGQLIYSTGVYVTPRFVHLSVAPLLFGLLLFYGKHRVWGPLAFLLTGVSSNLHFGSGMGLAFAFGLAWVLYDMGTHPIRQKLVHWGLCGFLAMGGALPYVFAFQSGQVAESGRMLGVAPEVFNAMVHTRLLFYPMEIYGSGQLQWPLWGTTLIKVFFCLYPLFLMVNLIMRRIKRERSAYFLLYFINVVIMVLICADEFWDQIVVAILPVLLLGIFDLFLGREPDVIRKLLAYLVAGIGLFGVIFSLSVVDFVRSFGIYMPSFYYDFGVATKYVPFLLNIYAAMFLSEIISNLSRSITLRKGLLLTSRTQLSQVAVVMVVVCCLGYRFWRTPYNGYTYYRSYASKVILRQPVLIPSEVQSDYRASVMWITCSTPKDARFLVLNKEPAHDFMFRYKAQRSMWVCRKDGGFSFYKGHRQFVCWYHEYEVLQQLLADHNPLRVVEYTRSRKIDYIFVDRLHYDWVGVGPGCDILFENRFYRIAQVKEAPTLVSTQVDGRA